MIDVRELRIGSHFHIGGVWRRVTGMNGHTGRLVGRMLDKDGKVCDDVYRAEDIEPIPITEELLAELGFKITKEIGDKNNIAWVIKKPWDAYMEYNVPGKLWLAHFGTWNVMRVRYLHELETLFYLTYKFELVKD